MSGTNTIAALLACAFLGGCAVAPNGAGADQNSRVHHLLQTTPLIDGHNDLPWRLREANALDLIKLDIRQRLPDGHTDIPRLRQGGVGAQFWSVYVPTSATGDEAVRETMEQIDVVYRMIEKYPDVFELARTAADVERIHAAGKIASLIGIEGGHCINGSLAVLRMFRRLGANYMTLTHSHNTPWADSATDVPEHGGLTAFGEKVVREMNDIGMIVDLSHVTPETMRDALRVATAPVIFSHSSCRALTNHPRNVPDDVLRELPKNGGVVMVTFVPQFVSSTAGDYGPRRLQQEQALEAKFGKNDARVEDAMRSWDRENKKPVATLSDVADHIEHVREICGIDHVGLGSDFDGISSVPKGLEDVSHFPDLIEELLRRGWTDADIKKLLGGNLLRVLRAVEARAARTNTAVSGG